MRPTVPASSASVAAPVEAIFGGELVPNPTPLHHLAGKPANQPQLVARVCDLEVFHASRVWGIPIRKAPMTIGAPEDPDGGERWHSVVVHPLAIAPSATSLDSVATAIAIRGSVWFRRCRETVDGCTPTTRATPAWVRLPSVRSRSKASASGWLHTVHRFSSERPVG
jgi:hypothetical protein